MSPVVVCSLVLTILLVGSVGCGGGPKPEDQERFQSVMNRDAAVGAAQPWHTLVDSLKGSLRGGENTMAGDIEGLMEDTGSLNVMKLPEEHRATASEILDTLEDLKIATSMSEAKKIIEELEELADKLPK